VQECRFRLSGFEFLQGANIPKEAQLGFGSWKMVFEWVSCKGTDIQKIETIWFAENTR
jgi:hypothetical protein